MSRQPRGGFWSSLFGTAPTHDRFTVEELQYLHGVLLRNPVVNDSNRDMVVEALRSIAELVIWGDQHDSNMVEYFLTENLLAHFNQILQQRSNRRGNVAMQVLQTLSILIQNLRNQQTVYYLFSNNHINEIVSMRFDFEDDEVLGYYVNLLKAISLKLNEATVQFFFHGGGRAGSGGSPGSRPASFPLYTESIKFVNHRDPMVRTAVKTLTLNVYGIPLPAVQQFVASRPAYFAELAAYIAEQCQALDRLLSSWDVATPGSQAGVEACLAEVEDLLSYCNDVLATGVPPLRELLLDYLWQAVVGPVLFWPLIQEDVAAQHIVALTLGSSGGSTASSLLAASADGAPVGPRGVQRGSVGPLCSLYVFERLFLAVTDERLLSQLVGALLGDADIDTHSRASGGGGTSTPSRPGSPEELRQQAAPPLPAAAAAGALSPAAARLQVPPALLLKLQYSPAAYRQALLSMLRGTDPQLAAAAVRVLASLLQSRAVGEEELELIGLLPQRRRKQRQLLQALVGDSPYSSQVLGDGPEPRQQGDHSALAQAGQQQQQQQQQQCEQQPGGATRSCNGVAGPSRSSSTQSSRGSESGLVRLCLEETDDGSFAVRLQGGSTQGELPGHGSGREPPPGCPQQQQHAQPPHHAPAEHAHAEPPQQQDEQRRLAQAAASAAAAQHFSEVATALLSLLSSELLPPLSLSTVGWLLHQLLWVGKGGALLSPSQHEVLAAAVAQHRTTLQQLLQGPWCDALAPMVAAEWGRCRQAILRTGPGSVHVAVQTWMQAVLAQELRWQQGTAGGGPGTPDPAAMAAKQAYLAVQGAVAVLQLQQVLCEGEIPLDPPCPAFGEAEVRRGEVRERAQIALGLSQRMHCTVCFVRGQERQAYFAVEGLPAHVKAGGALPGEDLSLLKPSVLQLVAAAAPVLLVADPGAKPETGLVLSVAPLMGAQPAVDPRHERWLHVQVRPPLRGLLKVLQASHPGNALLSLQKHLVSGHWVLSFPDGDRAASAAQHVEEWAHKMRAVYCQLLQPLLHSDGTGAGSSGPLLGGSPGADDSAAASVPSQEDL